MNKASGSDGIPLGLFHILKDDAVKVLHSICQQIWITQQWPQLEKSVFISIPREGNVKECSNYRTIALISHASKVMLKILQNRLQQYVNWEIQDVQAVFRKVRGTRDQIANIRWIIEKAREFPKNIYFCFIDYAISLTVWITQTVKNSSSNGNTRPPVLPPKKAVFSLKKQQLELDIEQQTGSQLGKQYIKAVYCHTSYLTYMQGTTCKMPGWMKHKWK